MAYIACGSALLYIKKLYFFLPVLALSVAATVANIKIRYDAKTPQLAIFGTCVICVFYSMAKLYFVRCAAQVCFMIKTLFRDSLVNISLFYQ